MMWNNGNGNCISLKRTKILWKSFMVSSRFIWFSGPFSQLEKNAASIWVVFVHPRWLSSPMARPELESTWIQITSIWSFFPQLWFVRIMLLDAGRQWINHNQPYVCYKDPYDVWYLWSSWARSTSGDAQNFMDFGSVSPPATECRMIFQGFSQLRTLVRVIEFSTEKCWISQWSIPYIWDTLLSISFGRSFERFSGDSVSSNCPGAIDSLFHLIHREENQGGSMDSNCLGMRDFVKNCKKLEDASRLWRWKKDEQMKPMCMLCPDPIESQKNCRDCNLDHPNNLRYERIDKWREIVASCQGERLSPWRHTWLSCLAQGGATSWSLKR